MDVIVDNKGTIVASRAITRKSRAPRVTICSIWDTDTKKMSFGVAYCSYKDIFQKKLGRKIALNRATTKPYKVIDVPDGISVNDLSCETSRAIESEILQQMPPIKL